MPAPPLVIQTTYSELLERCAAATFSEDFPADGAFVQKTIGGRRYWYFQLSTGEGRTQRYVGPETPELLERIAHHKEARDDVRERRALVSTLVRSFGLTRPIPEIGNIVAALARAGVFRLRGVLVGTVAYQCYSPMLGLKLPVATLQTGDVDIAQFKNVSVAIGDQIPPVLDVLKEADKTFRALPHVADRRSVTSYLAKGGFRVDFLTPNEGPETDKPQRLPALQTDAQPLRYLDFLIHETEPAAILHNSGVYVRVPSAERYAVHKLIISRRRRGGTAKRDKDVHQAEALLDLLGQKRPHELKSAWDEAEHRGKNWRQPLAEGLSLVKPAVRDATLKIIDRRRAIVPGLDLIFGDSRPRYDSHRDVVAFVGTASGNIVGCAISREAMDDHFGADGLDSSGRVKKFLDNRSAIERMARTKYLTWPVEEPNAVLIRTAEVSELLKERSTSPRRSTAK